MAYTYRPLQLMIRIDDSPTNIDPIEIVLVDVEKGRQTGFGVKGPTEEACYRILRAKLARDLHARMTADETDGTTYP